MYKFQNFGQINEIDAKWPLGFGFHGAKLLNARVLFHRLTEFLIMTEFLCNTKILVLARKSIGKNSIIHHTAPISIGLRQIVLKCYII